ncbi:MAG: hypothetical protein FD130_152 [Halothiobacillaceae bacterium]|nr:MAG: hypothetical protein FD130_152 [Halothiobacillaceae bacterium]
MGKDTRIIIIGIAILIGMVSIIIGNHSSFEDDLNALKPVPRVNQVRLFVLVQSIDGSFKPVSDTTPKNATLAFNLSSNLPISVSLLAAHNNKTPKILLKSARIPPGENEQLEKSGVPFTYQVSAEQRELKFCIIHDEDDRALHKRVLKLDEEWPKIPDYQCVPVSVS